MPWSPPAISRPDRDQATSAAGLLPADKVAQVASLPLGPVAMVGDGVNDAGPGRRHRHRHGRQGGHRDFNESADVVIMLDDLSRVATSIAIAQRTVRIALQAIWLNIAISIVLMLIAVWGVIAGHPRRRAAGAGRPRRDPDRAA